MEHVDVLIVGAGISGIGAACAPAGPPPGQALRDPRGARRASAGPGTCSATRASARTRTCTRSATAFKPWTRRQGDRRRRRRSSTTSARPPRARHRRAHPLRPHASCARTWSTPRRALDGRRRAPTPASRCSCGCAAVRAAATTATTRATRRAFAGRRGLRAAQVVHPQFWPEDLDYAGKRVVVIGSGATAVTLVPGDGRRAPRT